MASVDFLNMAYQVIESLNYVPSQAVATPLPGLDSSDESRLIASAMAGDQAAFASLVRPHLHFFTIGIHRILQNTNDTQVALQEALLSVYAGLPCFNGKGKFSGWAYRICLNEALTLRRSRTRQEEKRLDDLLPGVSAESHLTVSEDAPDRFPRECKGFQDQEDETPVVNVEEQLANLPENQRVVFILRDLEGVATDEVARKLGISRGLVRQYLHRARIGLRSVLANSFREKVAV